jgi:predicted nucleotidyltransferase
VERKATGEDRLGPFKDRLPALRELFARAGVVAAYLHGSYAEGCAGPGSDVDFAVLLPRDVEPAQFDSISATLALEIGRVLQFPNVDVRILNHAGYYFEFRVTSTGVCVYARSEEERMDYEAWAGTRWCDFQWYQDIFDRAVRERIEEGTFGR